MLILQRHQGIRGASPAPPAALSLGMRAFSIGASDFARSAPWQSAAGMVRLGTWCDESWKKGDGHFYY
jgi:hypothetical protein